MVVDVGMSWLWDTGTCFVAARQLTIVAMLFKAVAIALFAGGCGVVVKSVDVSATAADAAVDSAPDAPIDAPVPITYTAHVDAVPAVAFGGSGFCNYFITLQQLDVALSILPSGQVLGGTVQNVNSESLATGITCNTALIPSNTAMYTFASALPSANGMTLSFTPAATTSTTNRPAATLAGELSLTSSPYTLALTFQRADGQSAVLEWKVTTTVSLVAH